MSSSSGDVNGWCIDDVALLLRVPLEQRKVHDPQELRTVSGSSRPSFFASVSRSCPSSFDVASGSPGGHEQQLAVAGARGVEQLPRPSPRPAPS